MYIANKGRAKKFFQQQHLNPHHVKAKCKCKSKLLKGDTESGNFFLQKRARGTWVKTSATGQILFISRSTYNFQKTRVEGTYLLPERLLILYARFVMT